MKNQNDSHFNKKVPSLNSEVLVDLKIILYQASTLTYFSTCPFGQLTKKKYLSDSIF